MKLVSIQPGKNTITVRAPREQVEAAASLLDNLMDAKPELMIDVKEYEIDTDNLRDIGLNLPTSFQVFNIPSEIRRVLGPDAQSGDRPAKPDRHHRSQHDLSFRPQQPGRLAAAGAVRFLRQEEMDSPASPCRPSAPGWP